MDGSTPKPMVSAMTLFAKVSAWIVAPVVLALFVGRALDRHFATAPWIFIIATGMAFIISCIGIVRESKRYIDRISPPKDSIHE